MFPNQISTFPNQISWLGMEKLNLMQQKHAFADQKKCTTTQNKHNKSSTVAKMGDRGHNRHAPKRGGGAAVSLLTIAGNPSNTKWPGLRSTSVPSGVLIHPAVWPQ